MPLRPCDKERVESWRKEAPTIDALHPAFHMEEKGASGNMRSSGLFAYRRAILILSYVFRPLMITFSLSP